MRWFLTNLAILLGLDWLASAVVFAIDGEEGRTVLGIAWLGVFGVLLMLVVTLPGFVLYLGVLSRRRTRREAWALSPLLLGATWWTIFFSWREVLVATLCIPLAAALVRVRSAR